MDARWLPRRGPHSPPAPAAGATPSGISRAYPSQSHLTRSWLDSQQVLECELNQEQSDREHQRRDETGDGGGAPGPGGDGRGDIPLGGQSAQRRIDILHPSQIVTVQRLVQPVDGYLDAPVDPPQEPAFLRP